jgi:NitT/TauT family transport system substrate-binding protein
MEKGFFKQEGADVSGILSSSGGGTTIRNLLGGNLGYGEVDLAGTVAAIELGNDLRIISENVLTVGEFVWAVKPDSPIKSLSDFRPQDRLHQPTLDQPGAQHPPGADHRTCSSRY